jgi:hypothetical protein
MFLWPNLNRIKRNITKIVVLKTFYNDDFGILFMLGTNQVSWKVYPEV